MTTATSKATTTTLTTTTALTATTALTETTALSPGGGTPDVARRGTAPAGRARLGVLAAPMALLAALAGWVDHDADGV